MTTITLTVPGCAPRESRLRRLALTAGLALVRWAHQRPARAATRAPLTHEQQALRLATERAIAQQASSRRYGIAQ
jgi:hypothetical protein